MYWVTQLINIVAEDPDPVPSRNNESKSQSTQYNPETGAPEPDYEGKWFGSYSRDAQVTKKILCAIASDALWYEDIE